MQIADFALERYFARWEFAVRHVLCASDAEPHRAVASCSRSPTTIRGGAGRRCASATPNRSACPRCAPKSPDCIPVSTADDIITFAGAEEGVFLCMHALARAGRSRGGRVAGVPVAARGRAVGWRRRSRSFRSIRETGRSTSTPLPLRCARTRKSSSSTRRTARPARSSLQNNCIASSSIAELHGALLFSDEVYRFLEHDAAELPPAASCSPRAISLGVMSKAFGLAGLRIGWIATARRNASRARRELEGLHDDLQQRAERDPGAHGAAREATRCSRGRAGSSRDNLSLLDAFFDAKRRNGSRGCVRAPASVGFPRLLGADVDDFAARLVEREGVLILPASQFGYPGNHFRLGFGRRDMPEALASLERFASDG